MEITMYSSSRAFNRGGSAPFEFSRILLVADDVYVSEMVLRFFDHLGLCCWHAPAGEIARRLVENETFHLVIVDVNLGCSSGLDLIEELRELQPEIKFITMTGDNRRAVEVRARQLKTLFHLVKPFCLDELVEVITHTLGRGAPKKQWGK